MKKTVIFGLFVILQTLVFFGCGKENNNSTLFAQPANDAQRIVGTWAAEGGGIVFTFNANGTYTISGALVSEGNGNYMISNSILFIRGNEDWAFSASQRNYYLSGDGRILVFSWYTRHPAFTSSWTNADTRTIWLIKQ